MVEPETFLPTIKTVSAWVRLIRLNNISVSPLACH